jgi:hypothetical protein
MTRALAVVLVRACAAVAQAGVSQGALGAGVKDAADGQTDGSWTSHQVWAATDSVENDPTHKR